VSSSLGGNGTIACTDEDAVGDRAAYRNEMKPLTWGFKDR
jgi:hypothetical protein